MIRVLLLLTLLLVGLTIGPGLVGEKGYVLIAMGNLTIETSVVALGVMVFFLVVGFLLLEWVVKVVIGSLQGTHNWLNEWGLRKSQRAFNRGLHALAEGEYDKARLELEKIEDKDFDGVNLMAQAEAEVKLGHGDRANELWRKACDVPEAKVAATLQLSEQALSQRQPDQALALLEDLSDKQRKRKAVVVMTAQAMAAAGQWSALKDNLKGWKKILGADYDTWMNRASQGAFAEIASKQGAVQLKQNWQEQPRAVRKDPAQQAAYIQQLLDQGMHQDAQSALVEYQKSGAHPLLLPLYKQLQLPNPAPAIRQLEGWLKRDPTNAQMYSTLGHLAYHSGDNQLAEKALTKAITLDNNPEDRLALAQLKEAQQDDHSALQLYKQGVMAVPSSNNLK